VDPHVQGNPSSVLDSEIVRYQVFAPERRTTSLTMSGAGEVYSQLLLPQRHGLPIWYPEPDDNLPLAYREGGVRIGDVGIIGPDGVFRFLFNIRAKPDDPINCYGVPHGFEPLTLEPQDILFRMEYHPRGSIFCSNHLKPRPNTVETYPIFKPNVCVLTY
jgi:hypothetical protein